MSGPADGAAADGAGAGTATGADEDAVGDASPNLLVVCVDCLREDVVRSDRTVTPFLDGLRERGLECRELYASATTTTPAVASILTGTYAERNGLQSLRRGQLAPGVDPLAVTLGEWGYHTEGLVTGPLLPETGLDRGFDRYVCRDEDASVFGDWRATAHDRLAALPEPFAAFVHLWELHEDVHVPAAYDTPEYGATPYERALSALDPELEALVETVPEDTVVAVLGDHGESITHRHNPLRLLVKAVRDGLRYYGGVDTRGAVERLNRACERFGPDHLADHFIENGHGENVFDFTANVPFVLAGPGVDPATVETQVRSIDILPTLYAALDVDGPADGEAIDPPDVAERVAYMRACGASLHRERNWARAVRAEGAKYVEFPERDWAPGLYDLEADPQELGRVEDPALERRLREQLPERGVDPTDATELDIEDRLEDLGYR